MHITITREVLTNTQNFQNMPVMDPFPVTIYRSR